MMTSRFRKTLLFGLLALFVVGAAATIKYFTSRAATDRIVLSGNIEADEIHIGSKIGGRIAEVLVREGQEVKQGDALLRFEAYDLTARRADAAAAISQAEANYQKLLNGSRPEEVAQAKAQAEAAWMALEEARNGPRRQEIDAARAQLERARAALQQIDTQLGELEVKAPSDAFIEVLRVRPGDLINPGASVATLVELNRLWVRVYMPEPELGYAQLGKEVAVQVDTYKHESFKGTIESISSRGEFTPRNVQTRSEREHQVFALRVRVDNSSHQLRAGMAADVSI